MGKCGGVGRLCYCYWLLLLLLLQVGEGASYVFLGVPSLRRRCSRSTPQPTPWSASSTKTTGWILNNAGSSSSFDYEYDPPRNNDDASLYYHRTQYNNTPLSSSYPVGTPAGLRGEAIRSALRSSDRCLAWKLDCNEALEQGVVRVTGPGTRSFLHSKLTQSFVMKPMSSSPSATTANEEGTSSSSSYTDAGLLTAKGRLVDRIGVAVAADDETAYLLSSPGHSSEALFRRLDPFVFPLDAVVLKQYGSNQETIFSIVSSRQESVQNCWDSYIVPKLGLARDVYTNKKNDRVQLPGAGQSLILPIDGGATSLVVLPSSGLPSCVGMGITLMILEDGEGTGTGIGQSIWNYLVSDQCPNGPVEAGALEYESLRIEAGQPAFGLEMTGSDEKTASTTPASPLELGLQSTIDYEKGCYLGQEGIASITKNPRGPPRTLYQVVFEDEFNIYDYQSQGEASTIAVDNLTRIPTVGDKLYALGSNEQILVGQITSVAEPAGTGDPLTLTLALVRRLDGILKQLKQMDIEIPSRLGSNPSIMDAEVVGNGNGGSLLIQPPPLDPLDGLEVIVGGTFTIGKLRMVPSKRRRGLFDDDVPEFVKNLPGEDVMKDLVPLTKFDDNRRTPIDASIEPEVENDKEDVARQQEELAKAMVDADEAAAEALRKAEKMEMLRKRAEEAMERRKQKKS